LRPIKEKGWYIVLYMVYAMQYSVYTKNNGGFYMAQATAKQSTSINVRVDEDVKRDLDFLLDKLGLNVSVVVNMLFRQMIMDEALPFQPKYKRKRLTTEERLKNYTGDYKTEEWDTGEPVGREVF